MVGETLLKEKLYSTVHSVHSGHRFGESDSCNRRWSALVTINLPAQAPEKAPKEGAKEISFFFSALKDEQWQWQWFTPMELKLSGW